MARTRTVADRKADSSSPGARPPSQTDPESGSQPTGKAHRSKRSGVTGFPGLCIVATPIGNAADITLRALDLLREADVIACEDTRVTAKLLTLHGISRPLTPYHEHNAAKARPRLMRRLKGGESVALVSDAGTPLVSDPGYRLVRACLAEAIPVTSAPGPSALLTALVLSGLPTDRFFFAGFLPPRGTARRRALAELSDIPGSLVFMESARRLGPSLTDMAATLGGREAAVARELTKMFEEVRRGPLSELAEHYRAAGPPKGEITVVVGPPEPESPDTEALDRDLREALDRMTLRDAVASVAGATGHSRRDLYRRALALSKEMGERR
jgi:16S rRNA (cytidine1402-2'-O)-methyltransferase